MSRTEQLLRPIRHKVALEVVLGRGTSLAASRTDLMREFTSFKAAVLLVVVLLPLACGGGAAPPPQAGTQMGLVPDLRGVRVMMLPVQSQRGLGGMDPEPEVVFALTARSSEVLWVEPEELRRVAQRTPGLDLAVDRLPVGIFLQAEVERVGDPLFGHLRRLSAITNADLAFIPVEVRYRAMAEDRPGAVEIAATLIHTRTGRVVWFGIVEGQDATTTDRAAVASAAERLAARIVPLGSE